MSTPSLTRSVSLVDDDEVEPRPRPHRTRSWLGRVDRGFAIERIAGYVFFIGVWQLLAGVVIEDFILPPPLVVLEEMVRIAGDGLLWEHGAVTFSKILTGFAITLVFGTAVGVLMGLSDWWDGFFRDGLLLSFTTPGLIFVLVSLMVFGISTVGPIVAITLCSIPYVAINVWEGVRAVPSDLLSMARSFRMPRGARIRHIVIPSVMPYLFQGMRFGFAIVWKIAMLVEIFAGNQGIGFNIRLEYQLFRMRTLLAWVLWFFVIAVVLERLVLQRLVNRSLRWRPAVATR
ncbi:MAG: ABC transporter permease [Acidimicrobiales bacterium]